MTDRHYGDPIGSEHWRTMSGDPLDDPLDLEPIRARADAAAPGPWTTGDHASNECRIEGPWIPADRHWSLVIYDEGGHNAQDAAFIAHAREDVPALITEVERLRWALASCESDCRELRERTE